MDRIAPRELIRPSIVDERSAFDLQALAFLVAAVLGGVFLILFLLAFLPWLLAGALTAAVESLMRQLGFSKFTVDGIGDWVLVFVVGAVAVAILVAAVTAIAGVANLLSYHLTSRRDRGPAGPVRSQVPSGSRGANGAGEGPLRAIPRHPRAITDEQGRAHPGAAPELGRRDCQRAARNCKKLRSGSSLIGRIPSNG